MLRSFVLIAFFSCIFVPAAFGQKTVQEDHVLRTLIKRMTDAQIAYDPKTLDSIFTSDYIEISPVGEFDERAKVLGFYKPELKPDAAKMSSSVAAADFSFRHYNGWAIVITRLNFTIVAEGKTLPPRSMRAMVVCRKEGGEWKIASVQYTGIRPPAPPKTS